MIRIACPICYSEALDGCSLCRPQRWKVIPDLVPGNDPLARAEAARYDRLARGAEYKGHAETNPEGRARMVKGLLEEHEIDAFTELGPGFGDLLAETAGMERVAVDLSLAMLEGIKERIPDVRCVRGVADRLPLVWTPALVADGVFQTFPRKEEFLCEVARVADLLVMSVGFRHNYPRRPQQGFDVRKLGERTVLVRFLEELGFNVTFRWLDSAAERWVPFPSVADFLYLECVK
jgi:ubiquinone/menaquinone biosynthesis C-methylase UbiE